MLTPGGWALPPLAGELPERGGAGDCPGAGADVRTEAADVGAPAAPSPETDLSLAGWQLAPLQEQERETGSILPPLPGRPKRGRPFGSGTGSRQLRAFHNQEEQQARDAASAQALALLPEPGSVAFARQFRRVTGQSAETTAILQQPVSKEFLAPLVTDCQDQFLKSMAQTLARETPATGAGQKKRASKAFQAMSTAYIHPSNKRSMIGNAAESVRFNMKHQTTTTNHLTRMGALTYFCQRLHVICALLGLISAIMSGKAEPFLLLIVLASDSTPLPVAQKREADSTKSTAPAATHCDAIVVRPLLASNKDYRSTSRTHSKILQSEVTYIAVLRDADSDRDDAFVTYEFSLFCNLIHLDRGTGENTFQAWKHVLYVFCLRVLVDLFERKGRVVKTNIADRDGANGCADDAWAFETTSALHLRIPCILHMAHTVGGAVMQLMNWLASGVIANRLVLKGGNHNQQYFDLLVWVLANCAILWLDVAPPPEDDPLRAQQVALLDLLLGESEVDRRRAYVLKGNLRGDFAEGHIPVYANSAEAGTTPEAQKQYIDNWAYETASSLYVSLDPLQRGRWMLNTKHFAEHTLLAVVHQVGSRAFQLFDAKHRPISFNKNAASALDSATDTVSGFVVPVPKKDASTKKTRSSDEDTKTQADKEKDHAEENNRLRGDALTFWKAAPEGYLVVLTTCLLALAKLFRALVAMSGEQWDRKQQAEELKGKGRTYRLFAAASGEWTKKFFGAADRLMWDPEAWFHLPRNLRTEKYQSFAYSVLARMIGGIRHHAGSFQLFPFALFALLCVDVRERPGLAARILRTPPCMVDRAFGLLFLAMFPTVALLCGTEAITILLIIALIAKCDTGKVECRHASIRRILLAKSGSWASHVAQVSANYMCCIARTSNFACADENAGAETELQSEGEEDTSEPSQGYGGPARYFVRQWLSGQVSPPERRLQGTTSKEQRSLSFKDMWEEYRRIKAAGGAEWDELVQEGKLGTEASKTGAAAFGPQPEVVAQAAAGRVPRFSTPESREANRAALPTVLRESGASALCLPGLPSRQHRFKVLSDMAAASREAGIKQRKQATENEATVVSWSKQRVQDMMTGLAAAASVIPGIIHTGALVLPTSFLPRVRWIRFRTPLLQMVNKVFEQADGAFLKLVDETWLKMHEPYLHLSAVKLDLSQRVPRSVCFYARVCVCKRPDLRLFVKQLVARLRKLCHKDAPLRPYLDRCELIVRLAGLRKVSTIFVNFQVRDQIVQIHPRFPIFYETDD